MSPLPLPLRVAAGLAATAVERARDLPTKLAGLPVTVASQALQLSMRVQQQVTELAIRGDEALSGLRPVEETPEWATFDEDAEAQRYDVSKPSRFDSVSSAADEPHETDDEDSDDGAIAETDPWTMEMQALTVDSSNGTDDEPGAPPAGLDNYDDLSLPQLRARLRQFDPEQLDELVAYERANAARPAFLGMLTRRIATVRDRA